MFYLIFLLNLDRVSIVEQTKTGPEHAEKRIGWQRKRQYPPLL